VVEVEPGEHTVTYGDVEDYLTPDPQTFVVGSGEVKVLVGTYGPQLVYGSIGMVGLIVAALVVLGVIKGKK